MSNDHLLSIMPCTSKNNLICLYWKQLENKQEVKHSRFMKNGTIVFPNKKITKVVCFKCYNHKTMACNN